MKNLYPILVLILVSCSPPQPVTQAVSAPSTITLQPSPEPTVTAALATAMPSPTVLPTGTPAPCDPHQADYCVTDGYFLLQRPIRPPANDSVDGTYRYASTADGTRDPHHGVEMGDEYGTPVHAAADGVVVFAGPDEEAVYSPWKNFYGNLIVIRHAGELFTLYAHLSKIEMEAGDAVQAGHKIGEIGQSGAATGSHLHFEVRRGEAEDYFATLNPELWLLPARVDFGAMALSILDRSLQFQRAELTLQLYSDGAEILATYFLDTYDPHMPVNEENAAMSDLPAGRYRIALIHNGILYERWVEVQSGKLTQVIFVVE